jgi:hypothetical protein
MQKLKQPVAVVFLYTVAAAERPLTGGFLYIYRTLKGFFLKNCFEFIYLFYGD